MIVLIYAVNLFANVILMMLFARAILSWFVNPYRGSSIPMLTQIYMFIVQITDIIVVPCRRLMQRFNTGMLDFSVMIAMFAVILIRSLLISILGIFV